MSQQDREFAAFCAAAEAAIDQRLMAMFLHMEGAAAQAQRAAAYRLGLRSARPHRSKTEQRFDHNARIWGWA